MLCKHNVVGSIPSTSTKVLNAGVAQLVEQLTCNEKVEGSNPFSGTSFMVGWQSVYALDCNPRLGWLNSIPNLQVLLVSLQPKGR